MLKNEREKDRIKQLRATLDAHNYDYYVKATPTIGDYEFDLMLKELQELEEKYPELYDATSPTQRVGSDINKSFVQESHQTPMLSLGNTYSKEELEAFHSRVSKLLDTPVSYVCELKYDGSSISLTYEKGILTKALTRGDGTVGDNVTDNVKTIRSVPLRLKGDDIPDYLEIRGEVLISFNQFEKLNTERIEKGEEPYANPRNLAAGSLKLQNSKQVAERALDCILYYVASSTAEQSTHWANLSKAKELGFKTSGDTRLCKNIDEVFDFITYWDVHRAELSVPIDGVVIKVNDIEQQESLGYTAKSPRWAISYKFKAESVKTQLKSVDFQVGRTGAITPVANLVPVQLAGTIVKRASLHNADIIKELDLHYKDIVSVEKGGEIIPKITGVDLHERAEDAIPVIFIEDCPECNSKLIREEGEASHYCPNKSTCPPQVKGGIAHFVSRKAMDVDGLGEETIELLYKENLVRDVGDLYYLKSENIVELDRMGERSAERILQGLEDSKKVPFERVLYALGIRYVGVTVAKKIAKTLHSIDKVLNASIEELEEIDEIGSKIAQSIVAFQSDMANWQLIDRLKNAGVQMSVNEEDISVLGDALSGLTIVLSGTFSRSRDELKKMIEKHGGKNASSISKKTSYFLAGEKVGASKEEKVARLGVKTISEAELMLMIEGNEIVKE